MEGMKLSLIQDFGMLIKNFCTDCRLRGLSEESVRRYRSSLGIFADYFNNTNLIGLNMDMLKDFLGY